MITKGNLVDKDPYFVNLDKQDFRLKKDSPAFDLGFEQIPIEAIGVEADDWLTHSRAEGQ